MSGWANKPLGELPVIGNTLTGLDPRFENYSPAGIARLLGEVGVKGLADRLTDQYKLTRINRKLEEFAAEKPEAFFLQIGAYDGRTNDHLYRHIVRNQRWRGLVVEPIASSYSKLVDTYSDRPNVTTVRKAIHESPGERTMYTLSNGTSSAARLMMLSTFDKDLLVSKGWMSEEDITGRIIEETVECTTISELLDEHGIEEVDILEVDTEGLDALVLGQLDIERFKPSFIMFEHDNMPIAELDGTLARLETAGYSFTSMSVDTFCQLDSNY